MKKRYLRNIVKHGQPPIIIRENQSKPKNSLSLKDVLIPFVSALFVVICQQLFFESNKITELEIENIKKQIPALTRIELLTDEYQIHSRLLIATPREIIRSYDQNDNLIEEKIVELKSEADTILIKVPSFIIDTIKRKEFLKDLGYIKSFKGILDYDVYVKFEKLIEFIDEHPFPRANIEKELIDSDWNTQHMHDQFYNRVADLHKTAVYKRYFIPLD